MGDEVGDSSQSQNHMSADDLNDGFILDKEDKRTLSYQVNWFVSGIFLLNSLHKTSLIHISFVCPGWKMEHWRGV